MSSRSRFLFLLFASLPVACATSEDAPTNVTIPDAETDGGADAVVEEDASNDGFVAEDATPLDAPPEGVPVVYANTDDTLYEMDPETKTVTEIGKFQGLDTSNGENLTDIAVDANGHVFGVSVASGTADGHVYELELPAGGTGPVKATARRALSSTRRFYALGFAPKGVLGTDEALVGGDSEGDLWVIPTDGSAPAKLGTFGTVMAGEPGGGKAGETWQLSGDIVFFANGGAPIGLATIRPCGTSGCSVINDVVVEIDMDALSKKLPTSSLRKRFIGTGTGYGRLYGIGAWDAEVFAFQRFSGSTTSGNPAQLVSVSLATGKGTVVRDFAEISAAKNGWSGAGVTTSAKISIPK